ncbi:MAG: hypothetical protein IKR79_01080 [Bacteroidales bacterium]|nr:hypothetical protein [Bacteroidales bacterium]
MKKLILTLIMVASVFAASANSVRYFTRGQAHRVANTLDAQNELMIYCGYEYELATYVIVNEVWAERVNSKYYEIWLYGYDAYTGEEIYMPIDLACIWLYNPYSNRMYSAAQFLRFRSTVATPNFYWTMPPYNSFVRHFHDPHFNHGYTYHYEIHRYGWRPPMPPAHGPWPFHPYYMRTPYTPAPVPPKPFTPGVNYPQTPDGHGYIGGNSRTTIGTRSTSFNNAGGARSGNNMNNVGNPGTTNRNSTATTPANGRGTSVNTGTSNNRGNSTNVNTGTNNRGNSTNVNTGTSNRGNSTNVNTGTSNRGTSTNVNTGTSNRGSSSNVNTGTSNRSSNVSTGTSNRSSNVSTGTSNRSSNVSTGTSNRSSNVSTGTSSRSSNANAGTSSRSSNANAGTSSRSSNVSSGTSSRGTSNGTTNRGSQSRR